jgi:hypothetical protein
LRTGLRGHSIAQLLLISANYCGTSKQLCGRLHQGGQNTVSFIEHDASGGFGQLLAFVFFFQRPVCKFGLVDHQPETEDCFGQNLDRA